MFEQIKLDYGFDALEPYIDLSLTVLKSESAAILCW